MLPDNEPSSIALGGLYTPPDDYPTTPLLDYEMGGLDIQDPSAGLNVKVWRCWASIDGDVFVAPNDDLGDATLLFNRTNLEELSFSFDTNMQPVVTFVQYGLVWLYWYDSVPASYVFTSYPTCRNPKLAHDDKRYQAVGRGDAIFGYLRGNNLYYRQQRDRYTIERLLRENIPRGVKLKNIGMNKNWRLQFELVV